MTVEERLTQLEEQLAELTNSVSLNESFVNELHYKINEINATIALLQEQSANYATKDEVATQIASAKKENVDLLVDYVDATSANLQNLISDNDGDISKMQAEIKTELENAINAASLSLQKKLDELALKVNENEKKIEELEEEI